MKRIIPVILAAVLLLLSLSACSGSDPKMVLPHNESLLITDPLGKFIETEGLVQSEYFEEMYAPAKEIAFELGGVWLTQNGYSFKGDALTYVRYRAESATSEDAARQTVDRLKTALDSTYGDAIDYEGYTDEVGYKWEFADPQGRSCSAMVYYNADCEVCFDIFRYIEG